MEHRSKDKNYYAAICWSQTSRWPYEEGIAHKYTRILFVTIVLTATASIAVKFPLKENYL